MGLETIRTRGYKTTIFTDISLHPVDTLHVGVMLGEILGHLRAYAAEEGQAEFRHLLLLNQPHDFVVTRRVVRSDLGQVLQRDVAEPAHGIQGRLFGDVRGNAHKDYVLAEFSLERLRRQLVHGTVMFFQIEQVAKRGLRCTQKTFVAGVIGRDNLSEQKHPNQLITVFCL